MMTEDFTKVALGSLVYWLWGSYLLPRDLLSWAGFIYLGLLLAVSAPLIWANVLWHRRHP